MIVYPEMKEKLDKQQNKINQERMEMIEKIRQFDVQNEGN